MEKYGSDKPDLRYGVEIRDLAPIVSDCEFGVFKDALEKGGRVRGLCAPHASPKISRRGLDDLTAFVKEYKARGLVWFRVTDAGLESPTTKFFKPEELQAIIDLFGARSGDIVFVVADTSDKIISAALGALRSRLGRELQLFDPKTMQVAWILDFPLFSWNEEENKWDAEHHPFCQPVPEDVPFFETDPGRIRATSYDLVCNGCEAASGSVRIHDPAVQQKVFDLLGIPLEQAEQRFSFLLEALRYGAPPHAGIALGLDRWVMLFTGCDNIRDVIAFPKTQKASDLLTGAPSEVDLRQLKELSIKTDIPG
jgi:aspartyl-tRNA synthetase